MEHVSSVRPTRKFPEKVENLKRWSRFPGWNFRTESRVPLTFLVVCTSSRSTVGHPATYRGLRPNGTTFYRSEIPLLLPPKFPAFFRKWKAPQVTVIIPTKREVLCCQSTSFLNLGGAASYSPGGIVRSISGGGVPPDSLCPELIIILSWMTGFLKQQIQRYHTKWKVCDIVAEHRLIQA